MKIQFLHPEQNKITVVNLNNFEYLPLFYLFPKELLEDKCPSLVDMPRNVHGIFKQEQWYTFLNSDFFFQAVCDLTAFYVWPSFGISTYMEYFSGHDPMWRLSHATHIWEEAFEHLSGVTPQSLAKSAKKEQRWLDTEEFESIMLRIGIYGINKNNLVPCIQTVKEMRCIEDYDNRYSNAKIDFYRKWYHTRTRFKTISLDRLIDRHINNSAGDNVNAELGYFITNKGADFEEVSCSIIDAQRFYGTLNYRDREILEMRVKGDTYQEIADELGYSTHSAVLKRINRITEQYLEYMDKQE